MALGDLGQWLGGGTPSKSRSEFWCNGTIPWISPKDMKANRIIDTEDHITPAALGSSPTTMLEAGSVVVVVRSGILRHSLPVAVTRVDATLNQDLKGLRPSPAFVPDYVAYALRRYEDILLQTCSKTGTTVQSVEFPEFLRFQIPVAPLSEQQRIVAAIEEQFTRLDAAVAGLKRTRANLKRYRAAVLAAACSGRLVPTEAELAAREGRGYEPADQLLERILRERQERWEADQLAKMQALGKVATSETWKRKYKQPLRPDHEILPNETLPDGWTWATLGQLAWSVKDGPHYSPKYVEDGIPFISGGNVRPSGVDFKSAKRISPQLHEELSKRCKPELGDMLYTKGGTTGIARVNTYSHEFNVWVHVAVLKLVQSIEPFYLQHTLNAPASHAQAQRYTHGVGNQDLGLTRMVNIVFALPPLSEQVRIVDEVDRRLSVIAELETSLHHALARAERLRQSVLQRAFEGKLVPQDPTDEPAEVLLERIKQERATQPTNGSWGRLRKARGMKPLFELQEVGEQS